MSITLANFKLAVYSRLAADEASPAYAALNEGNITRWANEKISRVVNTLEDNIHYQALIVKGSALVISSGYASLPADFLLGQNRKDLALVLGSADKHAEIYLVPDDFDRWDSSTWLTTPTTDFPVGLIANGRIYVKPTSYASGKLDYVKKPTFSSASDTTGLSDLADDLLINEVVKEAKTWLENYGGEG